MRLNTLQPADGARTDRKRVGRGIGSFLCIFFFKKNI
jgi:large subunit ribosomal protein L15